MCSVSDIVRRVETFRLKPHVAIDAGEPPEILILQIRAVAPSIDRDLDKVSALVQVRRDVELRRHARILRIADLSPVHTQKERRGDAIESHDDATAFPSVRQLERAAIHAKRISVDVLREIRRGILHDVRRIVDMRVCVVCVDRGIVIAL